MKADTVPPDKAQSVTEAGEPDGFAPPEAWRAEVSPDGVTRLVISAGAARLPVIHRALVDALEAPLSVMYVQLTDRAADQHLGSDQRRFLAVDIPRELVNDALERCRTLIFHDGRHQLWIRGRAREQLVVDELGLIYIYPDDFTFRDALDAVGVPEQGSVVTMAERDYVKVQFHASADAEEAWLKQQLRLQPYPK